MVLFLSARDYSASVLWSIHLALIQNHPYSNPLHSSASCVVPHSTWFCVVREFDWAQLDQWRQCNCRRGAIGIFEASNPGLQIAPNHRSFRSTTPRRSPTRQVMMAWCIDTPLRWMNKDEIIRWKFVTSFSSSWIRTMFCCWFRRGTVLWVHAKLNAGKFSDIYSIWVIMKITILDPMIVGLLNKLNNNNYRFYKIFCAIFEAYSIKDLLIHELFLR